jgi:hypothetical protein
MDEKPSTTMIDAWLAEQAELFFGRSSDASTYFYARLSALPEEFAAMGDCVLSGEIKGPYCQTGRTLPATVPFRPLEEGAPALLARAVVPDMCHWTPDQPHLYRVQLRLQRLSSVVAQSRREWGLRRLGRVGSQLFWGAKPWKLWAARSPDADDAMAVTVVHNPGDDICEEASRTGRPLLTICDVPAESLQDQVQRLARWPAVLAAWIQVAANPALPLKSVAPNLLLGVSHRMQPRPAWADFVCADWDEIASTGGQAESAGLPLVACRKHSAAADLSAELQSLRQEIQRVGLNAAGAVVW